MAESTLSLSLGQLQSLVGDFLGYGKGPDYDDTAWTTHQTHDINRAVETGLRQFYIPSPSLIGFEYAWTFLTPTTTATLSQGTTAADLPDQFAAIEGNLTYSTGDANDVTTEIRLTGEGMVRKLHAERPNWSGPPDVVAVIPGDTTSSESGQRWQLYVFPTADQTYTFTFRYAFHPDALSSLLPYHFGGSAHSETVKAACLAAAELDRDDERGVRTDYFRERLLASVAHDFRLSPAVFGYNGDRSGSTWEGRQGWPYRRVTVEGVQY